MTSVAEAVVDAVIADGYLMQPEKLLQSLRTPSGRMPSEDSLAVATVASKLQDREAVVLIRAILDAATFSLFTLLDQDWKNSGVHARFVLAEEELDTSDANGRFHEAYRNRIEPNGNPTGLARARVEGTTLTTFAGGNP